ncbi:MAG: sugar-binding domain-containing protein [Arachnia sp.]
MSRHEEVARMSDEAGRRRGQVGRPRDVARNPAGHRRLLMSVSTAYYIRRLSRVEIADELGISRFKVARALEEAREMGLVSITVHSGAPLPELSEDLAAHLRLRRARVVEVYGDDANVRAVVGREAGTVLGEQLEDGEVLGIGWGRTLNTMFDDIDHLPQVEIVQLSGRFGGDVHNSAAQLTRRTAALSGGSTIRVIRAPFFVDDARQANAVRRNPSVASVVADFDRITTAVVGIGAMAPEPMSVAFTSLPPRVAERVLASGAVGEIQGSLFAADGHIVGGNLLAPHPQHHARRARTDPEGDRRRDRCPQGPGRALRVRLGRADRPGGRRRTRARAAGSSRHRRGVPRRAPLTARMCSNRRDRAGGLAGRPTLWAHRRRRSLMSSLTPRPAGAPRRLVALDMDGTLTQHKTPLGPENRAALDRLRARYRLVLVGAGSCLRIHNQLGRYPADVVGCYGMERAEWDDAMQTLRIVEPAPGVTLDVEARAAVLARAAAIRDRHGFTDFDGDSVEFHPSGMLTFALLGTAARIEDKLAFDPDRSRRRAFYAEVCEAFAEYTVFVGGSSSFDIVPKPFDKLYALRRYCALHGLDDGDVVFVGDDYGPGGNDEQVYLSGIEFRPVDDYRDFPAVADDLVERAVIN